MNALMKDEQVEKEEEAELASFSERVLAFCLDLALFGAGYWVSFRLVFRGYPLVVHPAMPSWRYIWALLFVLYQAYLSCEGRVSRGKKLLGLKVIRDRDGEPLGLGQAAIRSVLYPVSSILGLGFLWSLFNQTHQCWHDLPVGSIVVREKALLAGRRTLVRAGACLCLLVLGGAWFWNNVWGPRYHRLMSVSYAQIGLREMAYLEGAYHKSTGRYADNIVSLAKMSKDPDGFLHAMTTLLDLDAGITFQNTAKGFAIMARARDDHHTPVHIEGS
jgi:uncharacterized RDD family membrane protein YckC